jgi:aspartate/methionine/tyrosine aminotransferase
MLHLVPQWQSAERHRKLKVMMQDRPDLIKSELAGLAFDSLQQVFRKTDIDDLFAAQPLEFIKDQEVFLVIDPAAGGPSSDYAIVSLCRQRGIAILADEVYGTLVFDGSAHAPSFLSIADENDAVFGINSFSKPWAMTGWRVGWLVHPKSVENAAAAMAQCNNTGSTHFAQYGALAALSPEGEAFRASLLERCRAGRDVVENWIGRQNRVRWMKPDGAFYGFLHVDGLKDSLGFCQRTVLDDHVGVSPGWAFSLGDPRDDSYLRICFAQDAARLEQALTRLEGAIRKL